VLHEIPKVWNHFRRTAREIDDRNIALGQPIHDPINRLPRDDFPPLWPCVHVTMHARQIANLSDVHLKNLRMAPTQVYAFRRESFRKPVHLLQASSSTQLVDQLAPFNIKVHVDAMIISIIVPTLNEAGLIQPFLVHLRDRAAGAEIIVADGGSCDSTADLARGLFDRLVLSKRNRAIQMNAGARAARGDILWFVHVDAKVPWGCLEEIERIMDDPNVAGGFFRIRLPQASIYRLTDSFAHYAGILLRMRCGDHGIFCRRTAFLDIGGFPEVPLMEDVEFFRRLGRHGRVVYSRKRILASPRRYEAIGPVRLTLAYGFIATLYIFGIPLPKLASIYERTCCKRHTELSA
jgi:rSAM/selenodomain-associated transferase 2